MKTPSEQLREQEQKISRADEREKAQYESDFTYCRNLLIEKSLTGELKVNFRYDNEGVPGTRVVSGTYHTRTVVQTVNVQNALNILNEAGWVASQCPAYEESDTNCNDFAGMEHEMPYGKVHVGFPKDVEVGSSPSGEGILKPSEYLSILREKLSYGDVQHGVGKMCDMELEKAREFEVVLGVYWKIRQHILVPHVRECGWVVEELPDKIVISYPDKVEEPA